MFEVYELLPGRLYQSGLPAAESIEAHLQNAPAMDVVIDLTGVLDPFSCANPIYIAVPLEDAPQLPSDMPGLWTLAAAAADWIAEGRRVLVHCVAGINRSSLVNGMILFRAGFGDGPAIVSHIRQCRPGALMNATFAAFLETLRPAP